MVKIFKVCRESHYTEHPIEEFEKDTTNTFDLNLCTLNQTRTCNTFRKTYLNALKTNVENLNGKITMYFQKRRKF